jgi:hypothetical protein
LGIVSAGTGQEEIEQLSAAIAALSTEVAVTLNAWKSAQAAAQGADAAQDSRRTEDLKAGRLKSCAHTDMAMAAAFRRNCGM